MIAMTVRIVTVVLVVVGFTRIVVVMDVRMVSSTVAMIEGAHYIDLIRAKSKVVATYTQGEITFPPLGQRGVQIGVVPNR